MTNPATFKGLIDMITIIPKETDSNERKYKYYNKISYAGF